MIALKSGRILTVSNGIIDEGTLLFDNGKIVDVGKNISLPPETEVIDVSGKVVMPGLVEAHTHIGLMEDCAGGMGNLGGFNPVVPSLRVIDSIHANAEEKGLTAACHTGITTVQIVPGSGNVIGGLGAVLKTAPKKTVDEMVLLDPSGLKSGCGENPVNQYGKGQKRMPRSRMGIWALLREWYVKTENYMKKKELAEGDPSKMLEVNLDLESIQLVLEGKIPLIQHAHRADDIISSVRVAEEFGTSVVWHHATEGHRIADWIASKGIPCCWGGAPSLTDRLKYEMKELDFRTPGILHKAGVKLSIITDSLSGLGSPMLPVSAALCVQSGLPWEAALRAVTLDAADIVGVADRVGSLENGKDADIRVLDGDPFDPMSEVEMVIIDGEILVGG